MTSFPKAGEVRLTRAEYRVFIRELFERDNWRCRRCQKKSNLQCHHLIKRSTQRLDTFENCITLCSDCHHQVEMHTIDVEGTDGNLLIMFRTRIKWVKNHD